MYFFVCLHCCCFSIRSLLLFGFDSKKWKKKQTNKQTTYAKPMKNESWNCQTSCRLKFSAIASLLLPWQRIAHICRIDNHNFCLLLKTKNIKTMYMWNRAACIVDRHFNAAQSTCDFYRLAPTWFWGASRFLFIVCVCFFSLLCRIISAQPSKQFILNSINKLCDSSTLIKIQMNPKEDLFSASDGIDHRTYEWAVARSLTTQSTSPRRAH